MEDTPKHCLRGCTRAQEVWRWSLEILARAAYEVGLIIWGAFCWYSMAEGEHHAFEAGPQYLVYFMTEGTWGATDAISQYMLEMDVGMQERHLV